VRNAIKMKKIRMMMRFRVSILIAVRISAAVEEEGLMGLALIINASQIMRWV
jgi:hypothetical protein